MVPAATNKGNHQSASGVSAMLIIPELKNRLTDNDRSFNTLTRTIALSQGCFSLLLVNCNCRETQERAIEKLSNFHKVQSLTLPQSIETLYNFIQTKVAARGELNQVSPLAGLCICGLESVSSQDKLLRDANFMRDRFPGAFPFPLILWVNDEVHIKLIRLAPDFENIATSGIYFAPEPLKQN